jgi:hypothetical protein
VDDNVLYHSLSGLARRKRLRSTAHDGDLDHHLNSQLPWANSLGPLVVRRGFIATYRVRSLNCAKRDSDILNYR